MNSKKRKVKIVLLSFGFTFTINNNIEVPQCVICNAVVLKCIYIYIHEMYTLSKTSFKN